VAIKTVQAGLCPSYQHISKVAAQPFEGLVFLFPVLEALSAAEFVLARPDPAPGTVLETVPGKRGAKALYSRLCQATCDFLLPLFSRFSAPAKSPVLTKEEALPEWVI
jgi:hypothetical protein